MNSIRYPDDGQLFEDASILRNAVFFATAQRAFAAYRILTQPPDSAQPEILAFLAVDAFMAEMTSTEDLLGWLFVLQEWRPGDVERCLLRLLDRVEVGRGPHTEDAAKNLLDSLDPDRLRSLLHIPADAEFVVEQFSEEVRRRIDRAMPANLEALKRLVELRQRDNRAYVVAFNKLKHLLLGIRTNTRGREEVLVPKWRGLDPDGVRLQTAWIGCSPENVRVMASRAVASQAVLNSLLGILLWTRFGEPYTTPDWAVKALDLPGWRDDYP